MRQIYADVGKCRALIIDGNPSLRSMQALMLRDMGVGTVIQTGRVADARRALENGVFDIVLCDYHFERGSATGQDLLDDLRRAQLLPYSTVFIMVTGEASYSLVAEAAESALDSYLLKPHTALALEQRLMQARHRKIVLRTIFEAIEANDFEQAAALCRARFDARGEYWLYAARIGAELYIRLGDHTAARLLYQAVEATNALPWARLGIARAEVESGQINQASHTLETLISDQPSYADAYDVMGRVQVEQGSLEAALETYRTATRITPQSIARLQKQGMLAFYMGHGDEAAQALERSVRIGLGSKMFDCQSLVLLALTHFDKRETKALGRNHDNLVLALERQNGDVRLQRFVTTSNVFKSLLDRQVGTCVDHVRRLTGSISSEDFDFESASNLLAVLVRLRNTEIQLTESDAWITRIAQRFCVSKPSADMLCMAVQQHEPYVALIRAGHAHITRAAEQAMAHSVGGAHTEAVKSLMVRGAETLNAKLVELAGLVLTRHSAKIDGSTGMAEMIEDLKRKFCSKGTQIALGGGGARAAGALTIRS
jgi:CheY-like chemotaxis protein/predicted negative regulator of RcsB-dependent stress response